MATASATVAKRQLQTRGVWTADHSACGLKSVQVIKYVDYMKQEVVDVH